MTPYWNTGPVRRPRRDISDTDNMESYGLSRERTSHLCGFRTGPSGRDDRSRYTEETGTFVGEGRYKGSVPDVLSRRSGSRTPCKSVNFQFSLSPFGLGPRGVGLVRYDCSQEITSTGVLRCPRWTLCLGEDLIVRATTMCVCVRT